MPLERRTLRRRRGPLFASSGSCGAGKASRQLCRDKLLPDLAAGLADVSIGNLTVTEQRQELVDFVVGRDGRRTISERRRHRPRSKELRSLDDLSGQRVRVRQGSSYYESLLALNEVVALMGAIAWLGRRPFATRTALLAGALTLPGA